MLLKPSVEHHDDGGHRRGEGNLIRTNRRLGKVGQRPREVVPFRVVADHRGCVLNAVVPLCAPPDRRIGVGSEDHVHRHAIAPRVVDGHRRVLQAHGSVRHDGERLALRLVVGMGHGHRRFFVTAGDELRPCVAAMVHERLVESAEARARIGADVFEAERLEHVHHVVRAAVARCRPAPGRRAGGAVSAANVSGGGGDCGGRAATCAAAVCAAATAGVPTNAAPARAPFWRNLRRSIEVLPSPRLVRESFLDLPIACSLTDAIGGSTPPKVQSLKPKAQWVQNASRTSSRDRPKSTRTRRESTAGPVGCQTR